MIDLIIGVLLAVLSIALLVAALTLLIFQGRKNFADWKIFGKVFYAHRGLHDDAVPENSMTAFKNAKAAGYGVEFDVHLLKDGTLVVFHDDSLKRMTGQEGKICNLSKAEVSKLRLKSTKEKVPLLDEVLELFGTDTPLIIELKNDGNNSKQLCEAVCKVLDNYNGIFCVESFDPRCIMWLKKHRPNYVRGYLSQSPDGYYKTMPFVLRFALGNLLLLFLMKPDFIAYRFSDRERLPFKICSKIIKIKSVFWTLTTIKEHKECMKENALVIFEKYRP